MLTLRNALMNRWPWINRHLYGCGSEVPRKNQHKGRGDQEAAWCSKKLYWCQGRRAILSTLWYHRHHPPSSEMGNMRAVTCWRWSSLRHNHILWVSPRTVKEDKSRLGGGQWGAEIHHGHCTAQNLVLLWEAIRHFRASLIAQLVKNPPTRQETPV